MMCIGLCAVFVMILLGCDIDFFVLESDTGFGGTIGLDIVVVLDEGPSDLFEMVEFGEIEFAEVVVVFSGLVASAWFMEGANSRYIY